MKASRMSEQIVEILSQQDNPAALLHKAAMRTEELKRQLAVMWGEDEPHESGSECISCERPATQEAWPYCRSCLLEGQLEVCDEGFGDAVRRIKELEKQLREIRLAAHAVLAEVSSSEATDSLAVISLRRAVTQ